MRKPKRPGEPSPDFEGVKNQLLRFVLFLVREAQPFLCEAAKADSRFSWPWRLVKVGALAVAATYVSSSLL